jgi:hypothetical protein
VSKIIPKTDENSRKFWASVAEVAREVEKWPAWKKGGKSTPSIQNDGEVEKLLASKAEKNNSSSHK